MNKPNCNKERYLFSMSKHKFEKRLARLKDKRRSPRNCGHIGIKLGAQHIIYQKLANIM